MTGEITLASATQVYFRVPFSGRVAKVLTVINAALTTGDETLTVKDDGGNSMGTITLTQSGSAEGDKDELEVKQNNKVTAGDKIEVETDGSNGTATTCFITVLIDTTERRAGSGAA